MSTILQDLKFGLRMLAKNPGFTAVAVLTLALGIGANTAIFSFVDAVLLRPLPYSHPEQIVQVWEKAPNNEHEAISTLNFLDWKDNSTVFEGMAAEAWTLMSLTGGDVPVELTGARVSASYFSVFRALPLLGRTFAPDEDQLGKQHEVVLSHRIWENRFGANPDIIGRTIQLNGQDYTAIGVMPAGTFDRTLPVLWIPLAFDPKEQTRDVHWMLSFARLRPGVSLEQARQQMKAIGSRIENDYPRSNKGWSVTLDRYEDRLVNDNLRRSLLVLFAAVGAVLLIGCVNLANLLLVRGAGREREVAIRLALGGGRGRLIRQFLTECVLLACLGGIAGVFLGWGIMLGLNNGLPRYLLPAEADVRLDGRVLFFAAAIVIGTGILFGIAPAVHGARVDLIGSLKEGGRGATAGSGHRRMRNALVLAEIALAFVLLSGAGLLLRSFYQLLQVDPGFDATNVITMWIPMSSQQYPDGARIISYLQQVMEKVQAVPGVRATAVTSARPLDGWRYRMPFLIEGRPFLDLAKRPVCGFKTASPSYLSAVGMRLLKGRWLAETDTPGALPVTVINETIARRYFKDQNPIGQRVLIQQIVPGQPSLGPEIPWEVVGVVADEKMVDLTTDSRPGLYVSYKQSPTGNVALVVRGLIDPAHFVKSIQAAVWRVNKDQVFYDIKTLEQLKSDSLGESRMRTLLLGVFGMIALALAAIGIYGVISYTVAQRTHEMGLRAALGASGWDQLRLILKGGMTLTAIGMGIGIVGSLSLTRLLASLLFGVSPHDSWTLTLVTVVLGAVAGVACFVPARRATKVDPVVALRYE